MSFRALQEASDEFPELKEAVSLTRSNAVRRRKVGLLPSAGEHTSYLLHQSDRRIQGDLSDNLH